MSNFITVIPSNSNFITVNPSRMITTINFLVILFIVNGLCTAQQNNGVPFVLVDTRNPTSNSITLRCRRTSDDLFEPRAQYFRNGSRVDTIEGFNNQLGVVSFQISRRLEGEYSCGNQLQRSNSISFIGICQSQILMAQCSEINCMYILFLTFTVLCLPLSVVGTGRQ